MKVNGEDIEIDSGCTLLLLLQKLQLHDKKGLAVAINNIVVPKSSWDNQILSNEDKVTLIRATQGG